VSEGPGEGWHSIRECVCVCVCVCGTDWWEVAQMMMIMFKRVYGQDLPLMEHNIII
jgi:hypothetical protein